jgi:lipopolysaccharide export system permease protein
MRKLDKYIGHEVLIGIALVLVVLVGLFTFFSFIHEVNEIGKQRYGIWEAVQFVLLEVPHNIYDVFPISVLLGSLIGLGSLASNSELTVMRAAGVSVLRITFSTLRVGLGLTLVVMAIGEFVAPYTEQAATELRSLAQSESEQMVFNSWYGFWARDGENFINIRRILPNGTFGDVSLYSFDTHQKLNSLVRARTAEYHQGHWQLNEVQKTLFEDSKVRQEQLASFTWNAQLSPELVKIVVLNPYNLSSFDLIKYIDYLSGSEQRTLPYELAFWTRVTYPLISIAMMCIAIPFIFGSLRTVSIGQRILVGALIGIGFYMFNQTMGSVGLVYELNPMLSALFAPVLFSGVALWMMRRVI